MIFKVTPSTSVTLTSHFASVSIGCLLLTLMLMLRAWANPAVPCSGQHQRAGQELPERWSAITGIRTAANRVLASVGYA